MILIVGGAGSGKSAFAEDLLVRLAGENTRKIYIATMEPYGEEAAARIQKHRDMRAGKGFVTFERYVNLAGLPAEHERDFHGAAVLLECLGNLCANELYDHINHVNHINGGGHAEAEILRGIAALRERCGILIIISNEVFLGGRDYQGDTERYLRVLARLNRRIAAMADGVCEITCGIPVWYKIPDKMPGKIREGKGGGKP